MSTRNPSTASASQDPHASQTALHDLGTARFDHDVAAAGDRDYALKSEQPVAVRKGRAPKGLEAQVFAWNTMQYTTEDADEGKEDLHGGQLHRQNRVASGGGAHRGGFGGGGAFGGGNGGFPERMNKGRKKRGEVEGLEVLRAGMKPEREAPPLMKGMAEEMTSDMFWSEPLIKE